MREFDVPRYGDSSKAARRMAVTHCLSVGKAENGVNEAIQTQQNAVQQRGKGKPYIIAVH